MFFVHWFVSLLILSVMGNAGRRRTSGALELIYECKNWGKSWKIEVLSRYSLPFYISTPSSIHTLKSTMKFFKVVRRSYIIKDAVTQLSI